MNTPTTSTDFSRKCRDRVNRNFSIIRQMLEQVFINASDWNRFKIIDRALIVIKSEKIDLEKPTKITNSQSNKEACAQYRSKINASFGCLRDSLENCGLDLSKYRIFTRAGILEATIDCLKLKIVNITKPIPEPSIIYRAQKRKLEDYHNSIEKRSPSELSTGSISPNSDSDHEQPNVFCSQNISHKIIEQQIFNQKLIQYQIYQHQMMMKNYTNLNKDQAKTDAVFRPWI